MRHFIEIAEAFQGPTIEWFNDLVTRLPTAIFEVDGKEWYVRFYRGFSPPSEEDIDKTSVEAQFEEANSKRGRDKWKATGDTHPAEALKIVRAVIEACRQFPNLPGTAGITRIGFSAHYEEKSRIKLYDTICARLGGTKESGEAYDLDQDYYVINLPGRAATINEEAELIDEIKIAPISDRSDWESDNWVAAYDKQEKRLGRHNEVIDTFEHNGETITLVGEQNERGMFFFVRNAANEPMGYFQFPYEDGMVHTFSVHLRKPYRGKGIGLAIYKRLIWSGYVLRSDLEHSPASQKLWAKLARDPSIEVAWATSRGPNKGRPRPLKGVSTLTAYQAPLSYLIARKRAISESAKPSSEWKPLEAFPPELQEEMQMTVSDDFWNNLEGELLWREETVPVDQLMYDNVIDQLNTDEDGYAARALRIGKDMMKNGQKMPIVLGPSSMEGYGRLGGAILMKMPTIRAIVSRVFDEDDE